MYTLQGFDLHMYTLSPQELLNWFIKQEIHNLIISKNENFSTQSN